jgi:hypothetical protein
MADDIDFFDLFAIPGDGDNRFGASGSEFPPFAAASDHRSVHSPSQGEVFAIN